MELVIENTSNIDLKDFCEWLIKQMQRYIRSDIEEMRLIRFDEYLNNSMTITFVDGKRRHISSKDIIVASTHNLEVIQQKDIYKIQLDRNIFIPRTYAKFIEIVKLINYGNSELVAYPIYDKMMNYFAKNLVDYFQIYLEEGNLSE